MEYVENGSLHGYLKSKSNRRLDEDDAKRIIRQITEGLKYCHSRCITHRDIKLENLLLDSHKSMKIIDFGFSTCIPNDKKIKIFCGTPSYMAPEIVLKTEYTGPPADIWAVGVLMFTILCGQFPYRGATDEELYGKICKADYHIPQEVLEYLSAEAKDLLAKLFSIKAEERPSAKQLLQHPWLKETATEKIEPDYLTVQKRSQSQKLDGGRKENKYKTQDAAQSKLDLPEADNHDMKDVT
jgi:serine/threonine protein kinase